MASGRVRILSGGVRNVKIIREKGGGTLKKGRGTLKKGRGTQKGDEGRKKGRGTLKKGRGTGFPWKRNTFQTVTRRQGDGVTRGLRITYGELTSFGCGFKNPSLARKLGVERISDFHNFLTSASALTSALTSTFH